MSERRTPAGLSEVEYRDHVRSWCAEHLEPETEVEPWGTWHWMRSLAEEAEQHERWRDLQRTLFDGGFVGVTIPTEYGGQGGEAWMEEAFADESIGYRRLTGFFKSLVGMASPAFLSFGTEDQKRRHLPSMLSGDVDWCQLFSEPGAGSDLAGLACSAVLDGDEWVVSGQKVWNSAAAHADMGMLLVRTDPSALKHRGITFLLIDMDQPGVEVRPLVQAHGASDFCEVFLDEARVPASEVLGEVGGGWSPARMVLSSESTIIGGGGVDRFSQLVTLAREADVAGQALVRQELAAVYSRQRVLEWLGERLVAGLAGGQVPFDPSVVKLFVSDNWKQHGHVAGQLLGMAAVAEAAPASRWAMELAHLRYSVSIGGGTDEVHRNNVAERGLGLPRGPRLDKDVPWSEVPRN